MISFRVSTGRKARDPGRKDDFYLIRRQFLIR